MRKGDPDPYIYNFRQTNLDLGYLNVSDVFFFNCKFTYQIDNSQIIKRRAVNKHLYLKIKINLQT